MEKELLKVEVKNNNLHFTDINSFESRSDSMIKLFSEAFQKINNIIFEDQVFFIHTGDLSKKIENYITFGYTRGDGVVACPDFAFDRWIDFGIGLNADFKYLTNNQ